MKPFSPWCLRQQAKLSGARKTHDLLLRAHTSSKCNFLMGFVVRRGHWSTHFRKLVRIKSYGESVDSGPQKWDC